MDRAPHDAAHEKRMQRDTQHGTSPRKAIMMKHCQAGDLVEAGKQSSRTSAAWGNRPSHAGEEAAHRRRSKTVVQTGAPLNAVLRGTNFYNRGMRLVVHQPQTRGENGSVRGTFAILDAGDNEHSGALRDFLGAEMNAEKLLYIVRLMHPQCVNPVNTNALTIEGR
jgi:hypothetical protein